MDEELYTPSSLPPTIASPFTEEEEGQATHDYSTQLDQVLGEGGDDDEEEGCGEFVYSGVDVERPEEDKEEGYGEQLAELLGTTHERAEEQPHAPAGTLEAPSLPNGTFSHVPFVPVSSLLPRTLVSADPCCAPTGLPIAIGLFNALGRHLPRSTIHLQSISSATLGLAPPPFLPPSNLALALHLDATAAALRLQLLLLYSTRAPSGFTGDVRL